MGRGTQTAMSRTPGNPVKWATRLLCARAPQINMHHLCSYVFAAASAATIHCSEECSAVPERGSLRPMVFLLVQHQHQIDRTEHVSFRSIPIDLFLVRCVIPQAYLRQPHANWAAVPTRDSSE